MAFSCFNSCLLGENGSKVLEGGPWLIGGRVLILRKWERGLDIRKDLLQSVWVRFPQLGLHLLSSNMIGRIASTICKPLYMDKQTSTKSRLVFARVPGSSVENSEIPFRLSELVDLQLLEAWNSVRDRQQTLAIHWILGAAFKRRISYRISLEKCSFAEILDAYRKRGIALTRGAEKETSKGGKLGVLVRKGSFELALD
ncbi:ribosomal protein S7 [Canna indica]|uniref:Ribosomal protein S7 n=1 Tax=Canna indica TaxID=4628 RepID=A0AAQ3KRK2_9LILI|nr:ribosomal protein S7 [Canna indica]